MRDTCSHCPLVQAHCSDIKLPKLFHSEVQEYTQSSLVPSSITITTLWDKLRETTWPKITKGAFVTGPGGLELGSSQYQTTALTTALHWYIIYENI